MLKIILEKFIEALNNKSQPILNDLIDDNCLVLSHVGKTYLSKGKVIDFLMNLNNQIHLINFVKDSDDTLLTAFSVKDDKLSLFGSAIIRFTSNKISYIKIIIVN